MQTLQLTLHTTFAAILDSSAFSPLESFFPTGPIFNPFIPCFGVMIGALFGLKDVFGGVSSPANRRSLTTSNAIAGEPARPGESMPATCMKLASFFDASMIQSPREDFALYRVC